MKPVISAQEMLGLRKSLNRPVAPLPAILLRPSGRFQIKQTKNKAIENAAIRFDHLSISAFPAKPPIEQYVASPTANNITAIETKAALSKTVAKKAPPKDNSKPVPTRRPKSETMPAMYLV